ncbi:hypothetical protein KQX54_010389 [Cotesia glomerata]|uniref:Uncharacterized protein n=1 Tax=Cotesia glomerata TaxID=32391 RepID=A0AAV7HWM3_COTGL|nr:hypothetical protein KQX54_010389 [Cotesia glomerata]
MGDHGNASQTPANSFGLSQTPDKSPTIKYNSNLLDNEPANKQATGVPNLTQPRSRTSLMSDNDPTDGAMNYDGEEFLKPRKPAKMRRTTQTAGTSVNNKFDLLMDSDFSDSEDSSTNKRNYNGKRKLTPINSKQQTNNQKDTSSHTEQNKKPKDRPPPIFAKFNVGSSPSPSNPTGSPLAVQCPDSTVSQCWSRRIPALRIQVHQLDQLTKNYVSITYVKNGDKKQRGAMKGASDKSRSTNETSGVLLAGTESTTSPVHPGDNLPDDRQPRDIDIQPWSIVERLYRGLVEGQEPADPPAKGLSSEQADRDEHLKLEEAHLSAPLVANLVASLSSDRPHSCPTVKGSFYGGKVGPINKENDNKNENEQWCKVVSRPGRRSLDFLQTDVMNTCWPSTRVRNRDNFNLVTDKDFELPSAKNTLTGD